MVWRFEGGVAAAPAGVSVWIEPVIRNWNTPSTIFVSNHDLDEHKFSVLAFYQPRPNPLVIGTLHI